MHKFLTHKSYKVSVECTGGDTYVGVDLSVTGGGEGVLKTLAREPPAPSPSYWPDCAAT